MLFENNNRSLESLYQTKSMHRKRTLQAYKKEKSGRSKVCLERGVSKPKFKRRSGLELDHFTLFLSFQTIKSMVSDVQLSLIANTLGVVTMVLIVAYHYISVNDKSKSL
ncbi:uncharacterized protein B0P05DRAFT_536609 [Gilbertella persicaria]|uniref:uncharacterized protein n=1 Tax=Gilbertella persicaria TaxID=101096 RepID=UPI00221F433D|nr:uncharacterized protein B0P05DRAFT_536609 [Gilbertella persicaria]KAI8083231.1 hypothetical protein B0P05DRAFT_536609 [Gilbertella persicaria]